MKSNYKG